MNVKDLIKKLEQMPQDAEVVYIYHNHDGCDTCGYGSSESEADIESVTQVEAGTPRKPRTQVRLTAY